MKNWISKGKLLKLFNLFYPKILLFSSSNIIYFSKVREKKPWGKNMLNIWRKWMIFYKGLRGGDFFRFTHLVKYNPEGKQFVQSVSIDPIMFELSLLCLGAFFQCFCIFSHILFDLNVCILERSHFSEWIKVCFFVLFRHFQFVTSRPSLISVFL